MTIFPSSSRRNNRRRRNQHSSRSFRCESLETRRLLAIDVFINGNDPLDSNNMILLPNTPGQVIEIMATSTGDPGDKISLVNINAQLGDGDLNPGGAGAEPDFEAVDFTGTIWENQVAYLPQHENLVDTVTVGNNNEPSYAVSGALVGDNGANPCAVGVCDFAPNGVIARLIVDTTGFTSGTFPLLLSGGDPGDTHFLNSNLYEEQTIDLDGATGGQFQLQYTENGITYTTANLSATASTADVKQALDDLNNGNLLFPVDVTGGPGNWTVSFQGPNKFNDIDELVIVDVSLTGGGASPTVTEDVAGRTFQSVIPSITNATVTIESSVVDRHVFYNGSAFDAASDNDAVATNKDPLLPGNTATFANYTSYSRGLNGIMVDVDRLAIPGNVGVDDFLFAIGNNNDPGTWNPTVPAPVVTVHEGEGVNGGDRVKLIWNDNDIQKTWLQVTFLSNVDTGIPSNDVFYFGNAIGEVGDSPTSGRVNPTDVIETVDNQTSVFAPPQPITSVYDHNRDTRVNPTDVFISVDNQTSFFNEFKIISVPPLVAAKSGGSILSEGESDVFGTDANGDGLLTIADAIFVVSSLRKSDSESPKDSPQFSISDALAIVAELRDAERIRAITNSSLVAVDSSDASPSLLDAPLDEDLVDEIFQQSS